MDDCTNIHTYHTGTHAIKNKSAGEMTQLVRVLAVKPDHQYSIPQGPDKKRATSTDELSSDLHMDTVTHVHSGACKINK